MKRLVITRLVKAEALGDARDGRMELETSDGSLELRFTFEEAERLIAALQNAKERIQIERARSAKPPLPETPKIAQSVETAIDPVNQVVVLRAHLPDRTTQEMLIPRTEIAGVASFLGEALRRFESGAEMRQ
jgi:hypothetical protein